MAKSPFKKEKQDAVRIMRILPFLSRGICNAVGSNLVHHIFVKSSVRLEPIN